MGKKQVIGLAASVVMVGAWGSLFLSVYGLPLREDTRPQRALGWRVAEETVKLGGGGRVVLIVRDTAFYKNPAFDAAIETFREGLARSGVKINLTHTVKVDPLRPTAVPPGDFLQILKKAEEKDIVVSFMGPPVLTGEQVSGLGQKLPKIVAVCTGNMPRQMDLRRIFGQGLLHVAVLSNPSADKAPPATDTDAAWFDHLYTLVTPANLGDLSAPAAPGPSPP